MNIQFDTELSSKPAAFFADKISASLSRYETRINRITVHLTGETTNKKINEPNVCILEAHPLGLDKLVVSYQAATKELAVNCAIIKLKSALETSLSQLTHH